MGGNGPDGTGAGEKGAGVIHDNANPAASGSPMETYRLSVDYARAGKVDALYDLYDSESHKLFDMLGQRSGKGTGRDFFRKQVSPMLVQAAAMNNMQGNATATANTQINGNQAVIHFAIDASIAQLYPDLHLIQENGVWKLRAPEMFGISLPKQPTVFGGKTPTETFLLAASFMREGKTAELYALYDNESKRAYEDWARIGQVGDVQQLFGLRMHSLFQRAKYNRLAENETGANFTVDINGDEAILHTGLQLPEIPEFESDPILRREDGLWKLTMPAVHRKRYEKLLANQNQ